MKELMAHIVYVEKDETEGKWVKTRDRLRQNWAIFKTITMCRNYWFRYGRQATGIDERKKKKPDKMVTGVMDPEKRKRKRQEAKKLQEEKKRKLDADVDDEDGQTQLPKPKKRQEAKALRIARLIEAEPDDDFEEDDDDDEEEYVQPGPKKRRH